MFLFLPYPSDTSVQKSLQDLKKIAQSDSLTQKQQQMEKRKLDALKKLSESDWEAYTLALKSLTNDFLTSLTDIKLNIPLLPGIVHADAIRGLNSMTPQQVIALHQSEDSLLQKMLHSANHQRKLDSLYERKDREEPFSSIADYFTLIDMSREAVHRSAALYQQLPPEEKTKYLRAYVAIYNQIYESSALSPHPFRTRINMRRTLHTLAPQQLIQLAEKYSSEQIVEALPSVFWEWQARYNETQKKQVVKPVLAATTAIPAATIPFQHKEINMTLGAVAGLLAFASLIQHYRSKKKADQMHQKVKMARSQHVATDKIYQEIERDFPHSEPLPSLKDGLKQIWHIYKKQERN